MKTQDEINRAAESKCEELTGSSDNRYIKEVFTAGANFILEDISSPIVVKNESNLSKEQKEEFFRLINEMNSKGKFTIIDIKYTDEDMCGFAEWTHTENYHYNPMIYTWLKRGTRNEISTQDLLKLYNERK